MPASAVPPPTGSERSRLPQPIACETPIPNRSRVVVTAWIPVPDGADDADRARAARRSRSRDPCRR